MNRKYIAFLSSTYEDLKDQRKVIYDILLKKKEIIPVGMEYFAASSDTFLKYIENLIDTCSFVILVQGLTYGSLIPDGDISVTHHEFRYALSQDKPILFFPYDYESLPQKNGGIDPRCLAFRDEVNDATGYLRDKWCDDRTLSVNIMQTIDEHIMAFEHEKHACLFHSEDVKTIKHIEAAYNLRFVPFRSMLTSKRVSTDYIIDIFEKAIGEDTLEFGQIKKIVEMEIGRSLGHENIHIVNDNFLELLYLFEQNDIVEFVSIDQGDFIMSIRLKFSKNEQPIFDPRTLL